MRLLLVVLVSACAGPVFDKAVDSDTDRPDTPDLPDPPRESADLIGLSTWTFLDAEQDPYAAHRPTLVECGLSGFYPEDGGVEVDTRLCNYLAVQAPSAADVRAGDTLSMYLFHNGLVAEEEAEAHVAVRLSDDEVFTLTVPVPSPATPFDLTAVAPADAPTGTPITLHLHNHGFNTWTLLWLRVAP